MNISRRNFLGGMTAASAFAVAPGCCSLCKSARPGKIALQLYSLNKWIPAQDKVGKVALAKALLKIKEVGFEGVEFAGYYGANAAELKQMLADAGLVVCGTHVSNDKYGFDMKKFTYNPEVLKKTAEFELAYGNNLIICPGGGNFPGKKENLDDFMKMLVEYYNTAAETAAKFGCKVGLHNHKGEFERKLSNGQTYWDYFFSNTSESVCMEQDVGWTTAAGCNPCIQYTKYPHRSPTLHAKENGMGSKKFDAILGKPGEGAVGVAWDALFKATDADGVKWYVVECERHFDSLMPITESFKFLQSKGRC